MTVSFSAVSGSRVAALGIKANTVTPQQPRKASAAALRDLRRLRYSRRQVSRDWLRDDALDLLRDGAGNLVGDPQALPAMLPRLAKCGFACGSDVAVHKGDGAARYSGLQTCASIWACPTCAPIIRARRAEEIQHAADWWETAGGSFLFTTFTVRHFLEDDLKTSLTALTQAFTRVIRGAPWKRFAARHGIEHMIKSVEITLGWDNGWHAHLHVLFFTESRATKAALAEAKSWLADRWADMVVKCGGRKPSRSRGVDVRTVQDGQVVAQYISKLQESDKIKPRGWRIGQEMARIDSKKGRLDSLVPFDLLDLDGLDVAEVERQRAYWLEYVETTRGRRATTWSRGLKQACGLEDVDDDEILAEEQAETREDDVQILISARDWRSIMNRPDVVARILELVELGRADDCAEFVPIRILRT